MFAEATKLQQIREQISHDRFREAIDNFLQLSTFVPEIHRSVLLQKSHYTRLQNDELRGTLPRQEAEAEKNHIVDATLDTMPGSSGTPIFNDLWQVIGIYYAWNKKSGFNEGVLISHIHADAQESKLWPVTLGGDND